MFFVIIAIIVLIFLAAGILLLRRREKHLALVRGLDLKLLLIKLPEQAMPRSDQKETARDWKEEINLSAQLASILASLGQPFIFEAAVPNLGEEIRFYLTVPGGREEFAIRQIQGLWKDAQVEPISDFNVFHSEGVVSAAYLGEKDSFAVPIRTYAESGVDTFSAILSNLSKIEIAGEGVAIQLLAKSASQSARKELLSVRDKLRKGGSVKGALKSQKFFHILRGALAPAKKNENKEAPAVDAEMVKAVEFKASKPLFEVNLRLIVSAPSKMRADELLAGLMGSFSQFSAPQRNEFKFVKPRNMDSFLEKFSFRRFDKNETMILNSEELASVFHLPSSSTNIPHVKWLKSRESAPPDNLPDKGTFLGDSVFRGRVAPVFISDDDRRRHVYVIGQTGTGKTTLVAGMSVSDIASGKGVAVIDPHGDLIDSVLRHVPENRAKDVIIFDPSDLEKPLGINMLEYDPSRPEEKTFIVNEMQNIFNKLFLAETMGPMFEQYMRNALLLLMDDYADGATLAEVPKIFTDAVFRAEKLSKCKNPAVAEFWEKEAVKAGGEASLQNITPYITSKFNNFIANDYMRPIIGQKKSSFNFRKVMDEGKIVLVNLSKGRIGEINAGLLGMIITGKFLIAALSRTDMPEAKRRDFNLYIDEFQNFTTDSIATILSEARKYRLNMVMAHQFIAQLTDKIKDAVFGNVGSIVSFRIGAEDAEFLVKQFEPVFGINDLINIDNFNAYVKLLIGGATSKAFNIKIRAMEAGDEGMPVRLKDMSRAAYGGDRAEVEEAIRERLRGQSQRPNGAVL